MAFLLATDVGDFESLHVYGLRERRRRGCRRAPASADALRRAHTVRLDDPLAATRFTAEEIEFWRDAGIYYFVPCVSKDAAIAVLALGRRESGEPLTSEDTRRWSRPWPARPPPPSRTAASIASCTSRRPSSIACARSTRTSSSRSTMGCW